MTEEESFYIDEDGRYVFTKSYLLSRGSCCGNGCRNCPFEYENVAEPQRSKLLSLRADEEKNNQKGEHSGS